MPGMLDIRDLRAQDLQGLTPEAVATLAQQMLRHIEQQAGELQRKDREIERKDREIALREARLEKVQFELARLKRWKFGAKTEAMSAEQRRLFEETLPTQRNNRIEELLPHRWCPAGAEDSTT